MLCAISRLFLVRFVFLSDLKSSVIDSLSDYELKGCLLEVNISAEIVAMPMMPCAR